MTSNKALTVIVFETNPHNVYVDAPEGLSREHCQTIGSLLNQENTTEKMDMTTQMATMNIVDKELDSIFEESNFYGYKQIELLLHQVSSLCDQCHDPWEQQPQGSDVRSKLGLVIDELNTMFWALRDQLKVTDQFIKKGVFQNATATEKQLFEIEQERFESQYERRFVELLGQYESLGYQYIPSTAPVSQGESCNNTREETMDLLNNMSLDETEQEKLVASMENTSL